VLRRRVQSCHAGCSSRRAARLYEPEDSTDTCYSAVRQRQHLHVQGSQALHWHQDRKGRAQVRPHSASHTGRMLTDAPDAGSERSSSSRARTRSPGDTGDALRLASSRAPSRTRRSLRSSTASRSSARRTRRGLSRRTRRARSPRRTFPSRPRSTSTRRAM
jgi:hypothetical protein